MKQIKISIGDKEYSVKLAETDEQKEIGLQNVDSLKDNEGMLFIFDEEDTQNFWMKDTKIPLDIIFIKENLRIDSIQKGIPNSEDIISGTALYVLELNEDSGVKEKDVLEFITDKTVKKMLVLDSEGKPQMELSGGERIFSRPHTKVLIRFAKKAAVLNTDNSYKALGKRMFKFLDIQENTEPEYVESK